MDDPAKFPHLFHPELRDKTRTYCVLRSSMWSRWWYPYGQQISWFGGLVRAHSQATGECAGVCCGAQGLAGKTESDSAESACKARYEQEGSQCQRIKLDFN